MDWSTIQSGDVLRVRTENVDSKYWSRIPKGGLITVKTKIRPYGIPYVVDEYGMYWNVSQLEPA